MTAKMTINHSVFNIVQLVSFTVCAIGGILSTVKFFDEHHRRWKIAFVAFSLIGYLLGVFIFFIQDAESKAQIQEQLEAQQRMLKQSSRLSLPLKDVEATFVFVAAADIPELKSLTEYLRRTPDPSPPMSVLYGGAIGFRPTKEYPVPAVAATWPTTQIHWESDRRFVHPQEMPNSVQSFVGMLGFSSHLLFINDDGKVIAKLAIKDSYDPSLDYMKAEKRYTIRFTGTLTFESRDPNFLSLLDLDGVPWSLVWECKEGNPVFADFISFTTNDNFKFYLWATKQWTERHKEHEGIVEYNYASGKAGRIDNSPMYEDHAPTSRPTFR